MLVSAHQELMESQLIVRWGRRLYADMDCITLTAEWKRVGPSGESSVEHLERRHLAPRATI